MNNFVIDIINKDLEKYENLDVITRFPPEPNGNLHLGHAKSIYWNTKIAKIYNGKCNLRFDDTNPSVERQEYVDNILRDIKWLIGSIEDNFDNIFFTSDYFDRIYQFARELIEKGFAYVCDLNKDEIKDNRGDISLLGKSSIYRKRSVEENLYLFEQMRYGIFEDESKTLRAKIDMESPNFHMRDPILYRINKKDKHYKTKNNWCIYPTYDFAHAISDIIENITYSISTLEFEMHKPLYKWIINNIKSIYEFPKRIEFSKLNLNYLIMSKRKLLTLIDNKCVCDWDDPRLPTLSGIKERGYTSQSILNFIEEVNLTKRENIIDTSLLEHHARRELNKISQRIMVVINPIKLIIDNYPEDQIQQLDAVNNPEDLKKGKRTIDFSKVLYIDKSDFTEDQISGFNRLSIGKKVKLKYSYIIHCNNVVKNTAGEIEEIHCNYLSSTLNTLKYDGEKIKGIIHWVSKEHCVNICLNVYDRLFTQIDVSNIQKEDIVNFFNKNSIEKINNCYSEKCILDKVKETSYFQLERIGYFYFSKRESLLNNIITLNKTVVLNNLWKPHILNNL